MPDDPDPRRQPSDIPTARSIVEGTLAQAVGLATAAFVTTTLASFKIFMAAGWESGFGGFLSIVGYLLFKTWRKTSL